MSVIPQNDKAEPESEPKIVVEEKPYEESKRQDNYNSQIFQKCVSLVKSDKTVLRLIVLHFVELALCFVQIYRIVDSVSTLNYCQIEVAREEL